MNLFSRRGNKPRHYSLGRAKLTASLIVLVILFGIFLYPYFQVVSFLTMLFCVFLLAYLNYEEVPEMITFFTYVSAIFLLIALFLLLFIREKIIERSIILLVLSFMEFINLRNRHYVLGKKIDVLFPICIISAGIVLLHDISWFGIGFIIILFGTSISFGNIKRYKKAKKLPYILFEIMLCFLCIAAFILFVKMFYN